MFLLLNVPLLAIAATASEADLDEVVVTASRRATAVRDVSAAVGLADSANILSYKLPTDALADSPGLFLQQTTPGQGAVVMRGQKGSSILHLVDSMRLNNAIFRSAPTQYLALVPATAIERIESVRGTPTSLYGSDAVGGVVNVITRLPKFHAAASNINGELYAAYESADLSRAVRGILDVGNNRVATSISLEHLQTGNRRIGGGTRVAPTAYEARGGRYVTVITPNDTETWQFDAQYVEQPATPRIDELVAGFGQTAPSSSEYLFAPNRRIFAHARYDRLKSAAGIDWRVDVAFQRIDDDRTTRDFGADFRRLEQNRSDLLGVSLTASRTLQQGSWVAGFETYHDRVASRRVEEGLGSGLGQLVASRYPDGSSIDLSAVFVNGDLPLNNRNALSGGLRISSVSVDLSASSVSAAAAIEVTDISGDGGWRFDATEAWQIVANLGYGFRAPNIFDLGTLGNRPGNRFNIPNTALDSEHVLHADVGARFHSDRWRFELFAFALEYDDRITSVLTGDTTADGRDVVQSVNAAAATIYGIELDAYIAITDSLSLDTQVTHTRGRERIGDAREPADRIPPLNARLLLGYDSGRPLRWSAWLRFADSQRRLSSRDAGDVRIDPAGTAGWGIAGVSATWQPATNWTLGLGIDNLFDRRYRAHGSGIDAPGRNLILSVGYTW